ncbi:hypothetical protein GCM10027020_03600 [Nocardioides salsibiostraticola]
MLTRAHTVRRRRVSATVKGTWPQTAPEGNIRGYPTTTILAAGARSRI